MNREIERRFLVDEPPPDLPPGTPVRQGYVAIDGDVSVRARQAGDAFTLTIKGGTGRDRVEVEREIDAARFDALWALSEGRRVAKARSVLPLGEHRVEVDRLRGRPRRARDRRGRVPLARGRRRLHAAALVRRGGHRAAPSGATPRWPSVGGPTPLDGASARGPLGR